MCNLQVVPSNEFFTYTLCIANDKKQVIRIFRVYVKIYTLSPSFGPSITIDELSRFLFVIPVSQHNIVASHPELTRGSYRNHAPFLVNNFNLQRNIDKTRF